MTETTHLDHTATTTTARAVGAHSVELSMCATQDTLLASSGTPGLTLRPTSTGSHEENAMRMRCTFNTTATPEQAFRAYTDFTDRRLEIWADTLRPDNYALLETGDSWAVVREGSLKMGVVLRYTWVEPDTVCWSVLHSNFCDRGTGRLNVRPAGTDGARVEIAIEEHGAKGLVGGVILLLKGLLGPLVLPRTSKRALDRLAHEDQRAT